MKLTCKTTSTGSASYKYFWDGNELTHGSVHGPEYTVPTQHTRDNMTFTCTVAIAGAFSAKSPPVSLRIVGELFVHFAMVISFFLKLRER